VSDDLWDESALAKAPARFEPKMATGFVEKSLSLATRQTYQRNVREFFAFVDWAHPTRVTADDVRRWRDHLIRQKRRPATVALKLSVVRSFFEYLRAGGLMRLNPASTKLVPPPEVKDETVGRALTAKEVRYLVAGPDRATPEGARDYALLVTLLRLGLRAAEACSLKASSIQHNKGRWVLRVRVKGGRERTLPLPPEVKDAMDAYRQLDAPRRRRAHSDGAQAYVFQPHVNYRTLVFDRPLTVRSVENIVGRWAQYAGIGKLTPHDLRRTAITKALDQGLTYRQVQMMSGHRDPKTVMRYDHGRENLDQNAINFLSYDD
jgi:integrase/recombinase XerD